MTGDRSETAVSVGRTCGMIEPRDSVVMVKACKPEGGRGPVIQWEALEHTHIESPDQSDQEAEVSSKSKLLLFK